MSTSSKAEEASRTKKNSPAKGLISWTLAITVPFIIVFIIRSFFFGNFYIPSPSMVETLNIGDRVVVTYLDRATPERGDIVVFKDDLNWLTAEDRKLGNYLVKRVIAVEGDTVSSDGKYLYVNGDALDEPYTRGSTSAFDEQTIPEGKIWVMGDNRENSADSRAHIATDNQFVGIESIEGKVWFRYWPLDRLAFVE